MDGILIQNSYKFFAPLLMPGNDNYLQEKFNGVVKGLRIVDSKCKDCLCDIENNEFRNEVLRSSNSRSYTEHMSSLPGWSFFYQRILGFS